nr:MAG TPA: hypothetical protein [Caudoviricetes sp.]
MSSTVYKTAELNPFFKSFSVNPYFKRNACISALSLSV